MTVRSAADINDVPTLKEYLQIAEMIIDNAVRLGVITVDRTTGRTYIYDRHELELAERNRTLDEIVALYRQTDSYRLDEHPGDLLELVRKMRETKTR